MKRFTRADKVNTMALLARIALGFVLATTIGFVARRARALTAGGAWAAAIMGTAAVAAGWDWAGLLIVYFVSSTLLSRMGRRRKLDLTSSVTGKSGARDAAQVIANGGPFLIVSLGTAGDVGSPILLMAAAAGSLAASAADTWATEIGTLVGHVPRSVVTGRPLRVGESGGVTLAGSLASLAGAAFIAASALVIGWPRALFPAILAAGLAGSFGDSVAGALLQRRSWCDACGMATEMRLHTCGSPTRHVGGIPFIENDAVNLGATVLGAAVAVALAALFG